MQIRKFVSAAVVLTVGAVGAASAAIDVSGVTDAVTEAATAIGVVGAAVLVMFVGGKAFKWIKGAL